MKKLILLTVIILSSISAQACADEGFLNVEEHGQVTKFWIEGAYFNCYGPPSEKWHEFKVFCHGDQEATLFRVEYGDTLSLLLGKEPVFVAASTRYRRGNFNYGTSNPNVCLSGQADVDCFEEYFAPIEPVIPESSYIYANGILNVDAINGLEVLFLTQFGFLEFSEYPPGAHQIKIPPGTFWIVLVLDGKIYSFLA
jgi:hypothetical protein